MAAARNRSAKVRRCALESFTIKCQATASIYSQGSAAYEAFMEQENDAQIGALGSKVSELRALSIQIGQHVKNDNSLLDDLDENFNSEERHFAYHIFCVTQ